MSPKLLLRPARAPAPQEPLAINAHTWNLHYGSVQCDVYPHMLMEQALERHHTQAVQATPVRRRHFWRRVPLAVAGLVAVAAIGWLTGPGA